VKLYPFIEAEKAADHNVVKACELLGVSRSAFYIWAQHVPSQHQLDDAELGERIEEIHTESRLTYGAPRIHQVLKREGIHVGRKRVARIMVQKGLVGRCRKRWRKTTIADEEAQKAAELLKRKFGPGATEQDRIYVGDITYIRTWEGWLYLATVIDLSSRRIVGWAMADHMRTELVGDALKMAIDARKPPAGLIFHSDRGSQYTSKDFAELCRMNNITQKGLHEPRRLRSTTEEQTQHRSSGIANLSVKPGQAQSTSRRLASGAGVFGLIRSARELLFARKAPEAMWPWWP
jgi:transposase InsO family protein